MINNISWVGQVLAFLIVIACLTACGQKGALYLPDEPKDAYMASFAYSIGN